MLSCNILPGYELVRCAFSMWACFFHVSFRLYLYHVYWPRLMWALKGMVWAFVYYSVYLVCIAYALSLLVYNCQCIFLRVCDQICECMRMCACLNMSVCVRICVFSLSVLLLVNYPLCTHLSVICWPLYLLFVLCMSHSL